MDADGLIKLHRAGVLGRVFDTFACVIHQAVYDEVVTRGKATLHEDAEEIEVIVSGTVVILPAQELQGAEMGMGAGELGILSLIPQERDAIVVSDDRRFLAVLTTRGTEFLTPTDVLVVLARQGVLTRTEASEALERLRPLIRKAAYWDARQDLGLGKEVHEEE